MAFSSPRSARKVPWPNATPPLPASRQRGPVRLMRGAAGQKAVRSADLNRAGFRGAGRRQARRISDFRRVHSGVRVALLSTSRRMEALLKPAREAATHYITWLTRATRRPSSCSMSSLEEVAPLPRVASAAPPHGAAIPSAPLAARRHRADPRTSRFATARGARGVFTDGRDTSKPSHAGPCLRIASAHRRAVIFSASYRIETVPDTVGYCIASQLSARCPTWRLDSRETSFAAARRETRRWSRSSTN